MFCSYVFLCIQDKDAINWMYSFIERKKQVWNFWMYSSSRWRSIWWGTLCSSSSVTQQLFGCCQAGTSQKQERQQTLCHQGTGDHFFPFLSCLSRHMLWTISWLHEWIDWCSSCMIGVTLEGSSTNYLLLCTCQCRYFTSLGYANSEFLQLKLQWWMCSER